MPGLKRILTHPAALPVGAAAGVGGVFAGVGIKNRGKKERMRQAERSAEYHEARGHKFNYQTGKYIVPVKKSGCAMISAFGVDHGGVVTKADKSRKKMSGQDKAGYALSAAAGGATGGYIGNLYGKLWNQPKSNKPMPPSIQIDERLSGPERYFAEQEAAGRRAAWQRSQADSRKFEDMMGRNRMKGRLRRAEFAQNVKTEGALRAAGKTVKTTMSGKKGLFIGGTIGAGYGAAAYAKSREDKAKAKSL